MEEENVVEKISLGHVFSWQPKIARFFNGKYTEVTILKVLSWLLSWTISVQVITALIISWLLFVAWGNVYREAISLPFPWPNYIEHFVICFWKDLWGPFLVLTCYFSVTLSMFALIGPDKIPALLTWIVLFFIFLLSIIPILIINQCLEVRSKKGYSN